MDALYSFNKLLKENTMMVDAPVRLLIGFDEIQCLYEASIDDRPQRRDLSRVFALVESYVKQVQGPERKWNIYFPLLSAQSRIKDTVAIPEVMTESDRGRHSSKPGLYLVFPFDLFDAEARRMGTIQRRTLGDCAALSSIRLLGRPLYTSAISNQ